MNHNKSEYRLKEGKKVLIFTLVINFILALFKIIIGFFGSSQGLIADGFHSASDFMSTLIVIFSLKIACNPPDDSHPYGHYRSETLATSLLALSLIITGFLLIINNTGAIIQQKYSVPGFINIWAALFSIIAQEATYRYALYTGKKIESPALIADALHHRSDALSSFAALIGIITARIGYPVFDPLAGIIVAIMIIHIGIDIIIPVINELMEKSPRDKYINKIKKIALSLDDVKDVKNIKIRKHASTEIIEMIISVNPNLNIKTADNIAHRTKEKIIENTDSNIKEVFIHVDPQYSKPFS